jgi:EAL domain-containing protein (putative c-di-GMP-specific phosphodiesterase class I)
MEREMPEAVPTGPVPKPCKDCREGRSFAMPFTMAFQPIVDVEARRVFAWEALVRGPGGEGAMSVLSQVTHENRYGFDQACRIRAIELAARLDLPAHDAAVSINFLPNAVYRPEACIRATLDVAERTGFPIENIIFEVTEGEDVVDKAHLKNIVQSYQRMGFRTAIDDFGAGFSNLTLLAEFQPDIIKLDRDLVRDIDQHPVRRSILRGILAVCEELGVTVVAEGIETPGEHAVLRDLGIRLMQGYLFARPGFEHLPAPAYPEPQAAPALKLA